MGEDGKRFVFSDFDYVEIIADIERDPNAVTIGADPYVITSGRRGVGMKTQAFWNSPRRAR